MTPRVRDILSSYQADSPAVVGKLANILNAGRTGGTGKLLISDISQGIEDGPEESFAGNPNAYDPSYHFRFAKEAGLSALIAPRGFIEAAIRDFIGEFPVLLKINHSISLHSWSGAYATSDLEMAGYLGCSGVVFSLPVGVSDYASRVDALAANISLAKKMGLPAVVQIERAVLAGDKYMQEAIPLDQAMHAVHLACQLGANIVQAPDLDLPVASFREVYLEKHLNCEKTSQRVDLLMRSAFNSQRIVITRFAKHWPAERCYDELRQWVSSGVFGIDLAASGYAHPFETFKATIEKYERILLGV